MASIMRGITAWREPSGSRASTSFTTARCSLVGGKSLKKESYFTPAESTSVPSKSNMIASKRMPGTEIGGPVVDLGLALVAFHVGDLRILIEGIIVEMRGRDLLEDAAVQRMEFVPLVGLDQEDVARMQ